MRKNTGSFLVQDYVEGTTYRDLLNQRVAKGMTFSEAEVRQFLQQMLPVLAHIHSKGIIHRDISPDNIIQRGSDNLPVLIDFGVVKEVFTRIQMVGTPTPTHATSVGKLGYAPQRANSVGPGLPQQRPLLPGRDGHGVTYRQRTPAAVLTTTTSPGTGRPMPPPAPPWRMC